jgi:hypothetical protein
MPVISSFETFLVRKVQATSAAKAAGKAAEQAVAQDSLKVAGATQRAVARTAGYTPAPVTKAFGRAMMNAGHTVARVSFEVTRPLLGETGGQLVSIATSGPVYLVGTGLTLAVAGGAELWKRVSGLVRHAG